MIDNNERSGQTTNRENQVNNYVHPQQHLFSEHQFTGYRNANDNTPENDAQTEINRSRVENSNEPTLNYTTLMRTEEHQR